MKRLSNRVALEAHNDVQRIVSHGLPQGMAMVAVSQAYARQGYCEQMVLQELVSLAGMVQVQAA